MIIVISIIAILSIVLNIFFVIRIYGLIKELEKLYSENQLEQGYYAYIVQRMLTTLREIDTRGSFESDDEVGSIFNEIKSAINRYAERGLYEYDEDDSIE